MGKHSMPFTRDRKENKNKNNLHNYKLQTWLTTHTWFWKVPDVSSARPPTDHALFHAHTIHLATEALLLLGHVFGLWNSLPTGAAARKLGGAGGAAALPIKLLGSK